MQKWIQFQSLYIAYTRPEGEGWTTQIIRNVLFNTPCWLDAVEDNFIKWTLWQVTARCARTIAINYNLQPNFLISWKCCCVVYKRCENDENFSVFVAECGRLFIFNFVRGYNRCQDKCVNIKTNCGWPWWLSSSNGGCFWFVFLISLMGHSLLWAWISVYL